MIYPAIVAGVSLAFTVALARQYAARRQPHQLLWTLALALGLVGSLGYLAALQGSAAGFRIYYLAGALWMAPVMGLGSLYLHFGPGWPRLVAWAVLIPGAVASAGIGWAPLDAAALAALDGGPGQDVLVLGGGALASLIVLNTFGVVAVAGLALRSAFQARARAGGRGFFLGNLLLALGVLLLGMAGGLARLGFPGSFWLLMAVGFVVLYGGFVRINAVQEEPGPGRRPAARA